MKDTALTVAGIIFLLVAILHLLRLVLKWEVIIGGLAIPTVASVIALIVALLLSFWMFKSLK